MDSDSTVCEVAGKRSYIIICADEFGFIFGLVEKSHET